MREDETETTHFTNEYSITGGIIRYGGDTLQTIRLHKMTSTCIIS